MPLATKNGSLIVNDGKLAENCGCCCPLPEYSKFEWIGTPTASPDFCACYWNSVPLVKSINECGAYGGIPLAGLSRGRHGNLSQPSRSDIDGSASGYPTYRNLEQLKEFSSAADMQFPGTEYANAALRATKSALYLPDNTLIGIHSTASGQPGVLEGASVANPYILGSGHVYRISPVSLSEALDLRESQKGKSLKYCDGSWIADPAKPWKITAHVAGWPQGFSRPTFPDGGAYWKESWSHGFALDAIVASNSGMPLKWSLSQSSVSVTEGGSIFARGVAWSIADNSAYADGQARQFVESNLAFGLPATSACTGCDVKFVLDVSVTLRIPMLQFGASYGDTVLVDTVYCGTAYSPCVSGSGSSWTSPATRRTMTVTSSAGYGYGVAFNPYIGTVVSVPNVNDSFTFEV